MAQPQPGLFTVHTHLHFHQFLTLKPGTKPSEVVAAVARARMDSSWIGGPNIVWGFGPDLWRALMPESAPADLANFEGIHGIDGVSAPATQWDIWVWCHGSEYDVVWEAARYINIALAEVCDLQEDLQCYKAADGRDPIGFIDGTENPAMDEALEVSLVSDGEPGVAGTSVFVQKWIHNLPAFDALSLKGQEDVFGRSKAGSIEMDDDVKPATSHIARNVIVDAEGNERHIYRLNTPFASVDEVGTLFIGCTKETDRLNTMLARMFGTSGDGLTDHFTKFSTPVTGSWFFAPSMNDLTAAFGSIESLPDEIVVSGGVEVNPDEAKELGADINLPAQAPTAAAGDSEQTQTSSSADSGSLNIGSLMGESSYLTLENDDEA